MNCGLCRYGKINMAPDGRLEPLSRICRRYPPEGHLVPTGPNQWEMKFCYPNMGVSDWCGEFQPVVH